MSRLIIEYEEETVCEVKRTDVDTVTLSFFEGICELVDGIDSREFERFLWSTVRQFTAGNEPPRGGIRDMTGWSGAARDRENSDEKAMPAPDPV